jgi:F-type H+-transporting ATPase subunit a
MFFMLPLNLIGEIAKVVSISFRLFGNIMGGSIIILVVSYLSYSVLLPPFLNAFFGLFVGTVQAFVFTMLTLVYISVQVQ